MLREVFLKLKKFRFPSLVIKNMSIIESHILEHIKEAGLFIFVDAQS